MGADRYFDDVVDDVLAERDPARQVELLRQWAGSENTFYMLRTVMRARLYVMQHALSSARYTKETDSER